MRSSENRLAPKFGTARALAAGGLEVLEVTLRTEVAIGAIRRIATEVPEVTVGADTVTRTRELAAVRDAGGRFAVSPGLVQNSPGQRTQPICRCCRG